MNISSIVWHLVAYGDREQIFHNSFKDYGEKGVTSIGLLCGSQLEIRLFAFDETFRPNPRGFAFNPRSYSRPIEGLVLQGNVEQCSFREHSPGSQVGSEYFMVTSGNFSNPLRLKLDMVHRSYCTKGDSFRWPDRIISTLRVSDCRTMFVLFYYPHPSGLGPSNFYMDSPTEGNPLYRSGRISEDLFQSTMQQARKLLRGVS